MTVSKLHEYMTEKIVPESVVPQNIAACLMEDNPTIPELDAFTFLNRVRALGIGSADFLYLLKGCGAPEEAIEKIENNPAMNLQTLIVTLNSSGLTSKDYTRMLYTARQMWERTLTMQISDIEENEDENEPSPAYVPVKEATDYDPADTDEDKDEDDVNDDESPDEDDDNSDDDYEGADGQPSVHTGKITAAAVGACVLLGLNVAIDMAELNKPVEPVITAHYAADHTEVFSQIYTAYTAGKIGGGNSYSLTNDDSELFGNMLIEYPEALGVHNIGNSAFSAESNEITLYTSIDGTLTTKAIIAPPDGAEFVDVFTRNDKLYAVFSDSNNAGFTAFDSNGNALFSMHQSGVLTDIAIDDSGISFGTVYIPDYDKSFTIDDYAEYMPVIYLDGKGKVLPAFNIALSDSINGCGYALFGKYDLNNGAALRTAAALGDPVYSDADNFMAVMKNENGYEIIKANKEGGELDTTELSSLSACDMGDKLVSIPSETAESADSGSAATDANIVASAEKAENGADIVYLRDHELKPVSAIVNIPAEIKSLRLTGDMLYIYGKEGIIMVADISDPYSPQLIEFTKTYGITKDDHALCATLSDDLIRFTLYRKDENGISEAGGSSKIVKSVGSSPALCGGNTLYIGSAERCGAAYTYFDGVSVISEYTLFGKSNTAHTLFDDKTGFTSAAIIGEELHLIYGSNSIVVK